MPTRQKTAHWTPQPQHRPDDRTTKQLEKLRRKYKEKLLKALQEYMFELFNY